MGYVGDAKASGGPQTEFQPNIAQYAGFFLTVAAICVAALLGIASHQAAFALLAVVFGGPIAGRLFSLGMDRGMNGYGPTIRALYVIDTIGFVLAVAAILVG